MADIYFSDLSRTTVYQVPILPEEMPELSKNGKNEEFETFDDGTYNFLEKPGLVTFSIESFLPEYANKYSFAKSQMDPYLLINLWNNAMENQTPLRCIMERGDSSQILNWMVTVENMTWHEDTVGDVQYKIDLKQYRSVT